MIKLTKDDIRFIGLEDVLCESSAKCENPLALLITKQNNEWLTEGETKQLKQQILDDHEKAKNYDNLRVNIRALQSENQNLKYERVDLINKNKREQKLRELIESKLQMMDMNPQVSLTNKGLRDLLDKSEGKDVGRYFGENNPGGIARSP